MKELKIVATIVVKKEFYDELITVFQTVVNETRKEAGNVSYDLHQDTKNPLKFIILEVWKSQEAIDEHNASEHFGAFAKAIENKIEGLSIDVIEKIY
ncbi:antibiotic biosynthesis monooxygenase [Paludibacter sp. 221]|uniref:putative quinol monooxygenase n=1 Tax=Paludibacter sp. 221 TaxID=2302939 RepID=UPI0013CFA75F|nr:putative quinol monooxygenase [Paludibacter sp. 221]NDV47820.1 antibiotic biosynthesis monooxygenase [Paludibacter sp. 221]